MKFKKSLLVLLISSFMLSSCGTSEKGYTFSYGAGESKTYSSIAYYEDSYFDYGGSNYNPSLSTCSMALSMSAFNGENIEDGYDKRSINAEKFLKNYGFSSIYVNDGFKNKPTSTSVGIIIGQKKIGEKTLIVVALRGRNYETEWVNNITFGSGKEVLGHQGYFEMSQIYLNTLEDYIVNNNITGNIKLWSVGFSRGGAINNISLGQLDKMISKSTSLFNNKVILEKEDIYGYCFDAFKGVSTSEEISPKDTIYSNIHNVINPNNIFNKIGFTMLGFTSYGVDYYLPDSVRNVNYNRLISNMLAQYNSLDARSELGEYTIDNFSLNNDEASYYSIEDDKTRINYNVGLYLDEFLELIAIFGVKSQEEYHTHYEEGLSELLNVVFKNGSLKFSLETLGMNLVRYLLSSSNIDLYLNNLLHDQNAFINDFLVLLRSNLVSLGLNINPDILQNTLHSFLGMIMSIFVLDSSFLTSLINSSNIKAIINAMNPEITLAHLMALDPNYSSPISYNSDGSYYYLSVNNVTSETRITIKDKDDEIQGELVNNYLSTLGSLTTGNYSKIVYFYLPVEEVYTIEISNATTYSLTYFDQRSFNYDLEPYESGEVGEGKEIVTSTYPEKK